MPYAKALGWMGLAAILVAGGYVIATDFFQQPPGRHLTEGAMAVLFWPVLCLQILTEIIVIVFPPRQKQTANRESTRPFRAWLKTVFSRVAVPLALLLLARLLFVAGTFYDLTAFQGRYLELLNNGVVPEIPDLAAFVLLVVTMVASLLLPLTSIALIAILSQQAHAGIAQLALIIVRVGLVAVLTFIATEFINNELQPGEQQTSNLTLWLLMAGFSVFGDMGFSVLQLSFYGEIWVFIPFGIFLGLALLVSAFGEIGLTKWLLALQIRGNERKE